MTVQPIRLFGDPVLRTPADRSRLRRGAAQAGRGPHRHDARRGRRRPRRAAARRRACGCSPTTATSSAGTWSTRPSTSSATRSRTAPRAACRSPACAGTAAGTCTSSPAAGTSTASRSRSRAASCWRAASSTRPTTSTACCSSTGSTPRPARPAMAEIRAAEWFGAPEPPSVVKVEPAPALREGQVAACGSVFAGTPEPAVPSLRGAARRRRATRSSPCVTRPDAPAGRGPHAAPLAGRRTGRRGRACPVLTPTHAARPGVPRRARASSRPTAARWSPTARWCPRAALDVPRHGWVNLHFSLLPAWRGAAPVQAAVRARRRDHRRHHVPARGGPRHRAGVRRGHRGRARRPTPPGDLLGRLADSGAALLVGHARRHRRRHASRRARSRPTASRTPRR